jgi:predicted transcriptional regulator
MAKKEENKQLELQEAFDPTWITVMSSFINPGDTLKKLGPTAFTVMCVLRAYKTMGNWPSQYPSVKTIAERMGKTRATVHKALNTLEEMELIVRKDPGSKTKGTNKYKLNDISVFHKKNNTKEASREFLMPYDQKKRTEYINELQKIVGSAEMPSGQNITIINNYNFFSENSNANINQGSVDNSETELTIEELEEVIESNHFRNNMNEFSQARIIAQLEKKKLRGTKKTEVLVLDAEIDTSSSE